MTEDEKALLAITEDTQKDKYLTFAVGDEMYGIDIKAVIEIIGILPITSIPETPEYLRGIINLRGKIIPIVDMRLRFQKEFLPYHDRTCVIVVDMIDVVVGVIVDSVAEVLTIPEYSVVLPPKLKAAHNRCISGIGKSGENGEKATMLLDWQKLFSEEETEIMADIMADN